jgi:dTMP kinase
MKKGYLVVFEGVDGAGKTTQINLLAKLLKSEKIPYEVISFPQYGKNKYAGQIQDYLSGKLGSLSNVDPRKVAKAYASDRLLAKAEIEQWLREGKLVIANRYASASKAHLGANMPENKREAFFKWLEDLEYGINQIPKEDLTILLEVDPKVGQKNVASDKPDIHEESLRHLEKASKIYLQLAKNNPTWYVVDCMKNGGMKTRVEIEREVTSVILNELKDIYSSLRS